MDGRALESGLFGQLQELVRFEAEPEVGLAFTQSLVVMSEVVDDHERTARGQRSGHAGQRFRGARGVVQHARREDGVRAAQGLGALPQLG